MLQNGPDFRPLGGRILRKISGPAGAGIPVAAVSPIPLDLVENGVDPIRVRVAFVLLGEVMGGGPLAGFGELHRAKEIGCAG